MRVFYDTEFHERGATAPIEFISIGMVREDGEEYYAINSMTTWWAIYKNDWLRENVLSQLPGKMVDYGNGGGTFEPDESSGLYKPSSTIAQEVGDFCRLPRDNAELWAYYGDYDHVVLAQLFGRMIDLPAHMPMYTRDLKQVADMLDLQLPPQESGAHNALEDARWLRRAFAVAEERLLDHWWITL